MIHSISILALVFSFAAADASEIHWDKEAKEVAHWLSRYIQIDTTNPPGNEIQAARFLQTEFKKLGIEGRILPVSKNRVNFIARINGSGKKRPIVFTHHMDVVEANAADWKEAPFSGKIKDGIVWGRGALDMKGSAAVHFWAMKLLVERKAPLQRDLIFLALADEEDGSTGAEWMAKHGKKELEGAEFLINEGAVIQKKNGKVQHYGVATMEKTVLWLKLLAEGQAGHGSIPIADSAVNRLTRAISKIQNHQWPIQLKPSVEAFFKGVASTEKPKWRKKLQSFSAHLKDKDFISEISANPHYNALLRNTVAVTALQAGGKVNVIPGSAEALLDCRLLPGETREKFLPKLKALIADPKIRIEETLYFETQESPVETELMRAIQSVAARHDPGVLVLAVPLTSTTDSSFFRRMGIVSYGFEPFKLTDEEVDTAHGVNEHVSVENLGFGVRFLHELVLEME